MSKDKRYTEGPLSPFGSGLKDLFKSEPGDYTIWSENKHIIGLAFSVGTCGILPAKANAELWSLAPELVEVLRDMIKAASCTLDDPFDAIKIMRDARALLDRLEP